MTEQAKRGMLDSAGRMTEELLAKTTFKDNLRTLLQNIDPENAPQLARAIMWSDIEVPLALVCALPAIANSFIRMGDELARQIVEKFPAPVLEGFAESLLKEIDYPALLSAMDNFRKLADALAPAFREAMYNLGNEPAPDVKEVSHG